MRFILFLTAILIILVGCASPFPLAPGLTGLDRDAGVNTASRILWGFWDVSIDPDSLTAQAVPKRSADFTANVTRFMQPPVSPVNMIALAVLGGSTPSTGFFEVRVTLNHPFPGMNNYNGFDVRGILFSDGSVSFDYDASAIRADLDQTHMLNPDGFTRWWNPTEFTSYETMFGFTRGKLAPPNYPTATVNPYKYFADGLGDEDPVTSIDPDNRGFFTSSGSNSRLYEIQFAMDGGQPVFDFQYAVDASWNPPDQSYAPGFPKEAFSLDANMAEAWAMTADDEGSTAYYVDSATYGGELEFALEIYDWQSQENPLGVSGEISGIWLEGGVIDGVYDVLSNATISPGSTYVSSVFEVTIENPILTKSGMETLWLVVESANPSMYEPQVTGGSSFDFPDSALASYFAFEVEIGDEAPFVNDPAIPDTLCPMWGFPGDLLTEISLEGTNIMDGATVEIESGSGLIIEGENIVFIDDTSIEFDLNLAGADIGYYTLRVTNPSALPGEQEDGFEVMDPDNLPTWYAVQGDRAHTGMVGLYGPCDVHAGPTWTHLWQPNPYGNPLPIYLNDKTCFISNTGDGGPLPCGAVDFINKVTLWNQQFHDDMQNWLNLKAITEDGSIALTFETGYHRLIGLEGATGNFLWEIPGVDTRVDSLPTLDLDGNFIVPIQNSGYMSIEPESGDINWNSNTGDMYYTQPAVGANGRIYAYDGSQNSGQLMALDPSNGSVIWYSGSIGEARGNGVTVHPNGTIIMPTVNGLLCLTDDGTSASTAWLVPYVCPFYSSVAIAPDGTILFVEWSGTLHRIDDETGLSIDSVALPPGDTPSNRPSVSKDGHIYLRTRDYMGNQTYVSCYDKNLELKWQWYHGLWIGAAGMPEDPVIGQDGTIYASSRIFGLMAWKDD